MSCLDPGFEYTDAHHEHYEKLGYCIFDRFLSAEGLERCRSEIERMLGQLQPGRDPGHIYSAHQSEPWIFELATDPKVLHMLERQIGANIVLWSSHMICKPPGAGIGIPWHQDAPYWNVGGPLPAGLWIGFDDMDEENGAMSIIPGWHKKGTLARKIDPDEKHFSEEIDPSLIPDNVDELKVQYRFSAGGMAIHDTMIPHNSSPNRSNRWRRVLVLRYMSAAGKMGAKTYEHYQTGDPFEREYFLVRGEDVSGRGLRTSPFVDA